MIAGSPRWPPRLRSEANAWQEPVAGVGAGVVVFPRPRLAGVRFVGRLALLVLVVVAVGAVAGRATGNRLVPALAVVAAAAAALVYARRWRRTVRRVEASRRGLTVITHGGGRVALDWDDIAWVTTRLVPVVGGLRLRIVRLQRREGAGLALPGDLVGLDELVRLVERQGDLA